MEASTNELRGLFLVWQVIVIPPWPAAPVGPAICLAIFHVRITAESIDAMRMSAGLAPERRFVHREWVTC